MTDNGIVTLDAPRRIKNEDGSPVLPDAPPIAPTPTPASPSPTVESVYSSQPKQPKSTVPDWVDEQLLVAQIKHAQSWLLCDKCALNMVPVQQYTTCSSCHNLKFPDGTQWFADELGRRHQI
jgi:hypothetical protein